MKFLTFFPEGPPQIRPPSRVYARVDRLEPRPSGGGDAVTALLDSVDADWFDRIRGEVDTLMDPRLAASLEDHVSMLEVPYERGTAHAELAVEDEEAWLELSLADGAPWPDVFHFLNLFAPPLERSLAAMHRADPPTEDDLNRMTTIDVLPESDVAELDAILGVEAPQAAAVYDVGQGGCNALLVGGAPKLYFDFGGGTRNNAPSFPPQLRSFCFDDDPPIVLSHWDDDHWSSAGRDSRAYAAMWLAPRQKVGVTHNAHIAKIHAAGGSMLLWPSGLAARTSGALTVEKCTGGPSNRNYSGLALIVEGPEGKRILFPADARYQDVPGSALDFTHLAAAHHGGLPTPRNVPPSDRAICGRLAYSYAQPNTYHHPVAAVEAKHAAVWSYDLRTEHRRPSSGLGHIHLYWDDADPDADPRCIAGGCTGTCDLTCQQR